MLCTKSMYSPHIWAVYSKTVWTSKPSGQESQFLAWQLIHSLPSAELNTVNRASFPHTSAWKPHQPPPFHSPKRAKREGGGGFQMSLDNMHYWHGHVGAQVRLGMKYFDVVWLQSNWSTLRQQHPGKWLIVFLAGATCRATKNKSYHCLVKATLTLSLPYARCIFFQMTLLLSHVVSPLRATTWWGIYGVGTYYISP